MPHHNLPHHTIKTQNPTLPLQMAANSLKSKCNLELMENLLSVIAKQGIVVNSHFGWDSPGFWLKITGSQNLLLSTFIKLRANSIPVRPCFVSYNQASTSQIYPFATTWLPDANSEMAIRLPPTIFLFYMHKTLNSLPCAGRLCHACWFSVIATATSQQAAGVVVVR